MTDDYSFYFLFFLKFYPSFIQKSEKKYLDFHIKNLKKERRELRIKSEGFLLRWEDDLAYRESKHREELKKNWRQIKRERDRFEDDKKMHEYSRSRFGAVTHDPQPVKVIK